MPPLEEWLTTSNRQDWAGPLFWPTVCQAGLVSFQNLVCEVAFMSMSKSPESYSWKGRAGILTHLSRNRALGQLTKKNSASLILLAPFSPLSDKNSFQIFSNDLTFQHNSKIGFKLSLFFSPKSENKILTGEFFTRYFVDCKWGQEY